MKSIIKFYSIFFLFFTIVLTGSCKKSFFYPGINNNPGSVKGDQLSPSVLLNGAETSIGYTVGGDISRYSSVLVNSVQGNLRQFQAYNNYIFSAQDFDNVWSNIYQQGLNNLYTLKKLSDKNSFNYYGGISRVLLAYYFGLTTDLWGDIPRTEALQGDLGIVQPGYDSQENIYQYLQSTLDTAILKLSGTDNGKVPGDDDFIYGGTTANWIALANSLKARYYLHLSKKDPNYASKVLSLLPSSISTPAGNAAIPFFNNVSQANPWYQYIQDRGDISYVNAYLNTQLLAIADPRANVYFNQADDNLGTLFAGIAAPVTLMSMTEVLFMKAEALSAIDDAGATSAYNAAVASSFADANVSMPANYLTTTAALNGATHADRLPQIIKQKYFALFTQPEVFNDWRRTGYPALTPNTGTKIPRRFLYPQQELSFNKANVPSGTTLYTKVWWDN